MQLHWTLCEEAAQTGTRPSWEEMQRLYPGIRREGPACDAPGQEGCPADSEALYRPRMYGTEDGLDRFSGGASGPAAEQPSGDGCGDGSAAEPETIRRPPRPSGDELYRAAVDEALAAAASKPLDHFRSGEGRTCFWRNCIAPCASLPQLRRLCGCSVSVDSAVTSLDGEPSCL